MISHRHQCIFIHIPKTAGTSIEHKLGAFSELRAGVQDHRTVKDIVRDRIESPSLFARFLKFRQKSEPQGDKPRVTTRQFDRYFKFTIVRNPWARAYSWYRNVMGDPNHQAKHKVDPKCTFPRFLQDHGHLWALRPQLHWIVDDGGEVPLDYVGRFEELPHAFEPVAEELGIEDPELPTLMMKPGKRPSYVDAYDPASIDLVAEKYRDEIAMFGFEFGE